MLMRKDLPSNGTKWGSVHVREGGDLKKPRIPRCSSDQEALALMASARWEQIRMGIAEAALARKDSLVPALAYLAKHGCNDSLGGQLKERNGQFRNIEPMLFAERLERNGKVGRSTATCLIPAVAMNEIRASPDPRETANKWRKRLASEEMLERSITRKRAIEALAEIGTPKALAELVKLLRYETDNMDMRAASALSRAASSNPEGALPLLRRMEAELDAMGGAEKESGVLKAICERLESR